MTERVLVKNAADPEQVKQAATRSKHRRETELADVRAVMSTLEGRRLIWRQLLAGKMFENRFSDNSLRMAFNEGNANQASWLLADIDAACPELYDTMRREARKSEESNG